MTKYVATVNIPGYLPMDDDPPVFATPQEAWQWLADQREHIEDVLAPDESEYSDTVSELRYMAEGAEYGNPYEDWPVRADGTGTVYGDTPGLSGDGHDCGLAYSVSATEDEDDNED